MLPSLPVAFAAAAAIALIAWRRGSLTTGGALAATAVGTIVFAAGGAAWGAVLIFFFVSSSALGRLRSEQKAVAEALFAKGHRRDASQVLANGSVAALLALGHVLAGGEVWWPAFIGTMAAVTADTWATEVGTLSRQPPRLITTLAPVAAGTSGGVTPAGLGASLAGAALAGLVAGIAAGIAAPARPVFDVVMVAIAGGVVGTLADSLLGATVQASYRCDGCGQPTEARQHRCGSASRRVRGVGWIDNDVVNVAAALVGAATGAGFSAW